MLMQKYDLLCSLILQKIKKCGQNNVSIHINIYQNWFINESARKKKGKPSNHIILERWSFFVGYKRTFLIIFLCLPVCLIFITIFSKKWSIWESINYTVLAFLEDRKIGETSKICQIKLFIFQYFNGNIGHFSIALNIVIFLSTLQ